MRLEEHTEVAAGKVGRRRRRYMEGGERVVGLDSSGSG